LRILVRVPPRPPNESARLEALHALQVLDTEPEERFDRITRLTKELFDVPIVLVSLVDAERHWFKCAYGLSATETPREISFCAHAILEADPFIVENALVDPRFADNPLVTQDPAIRFYAGQPLSTLDGHRVGTLCIIDHKPRKLTPRQIGLLKDLGALVENELNRITNEMLRQTVQQADERLRKFFTLSLDMLCIANWDGYFTSLNPAWSETLGYSLEKLCERPFIDFVHPEDRNKTIEETKELASGRLTVHFENRYRCRDGSYKHVLWSAAPDPEAKLFYAVARDVSKFHRAEEELRRAIQLSEEASHAKTRFMANMSHEFRTPLNSIIGFANVVLSGESLADDEHQPLSHHQRDYIERIRKNGLHLLELVNDLLDLSKIEAGKIDFKFEPVQLQNLLSDVVEELDVQAKGKGIELRADVPERLQPARTDPQRLKQVLINLVGNAIKFTEEGGVTLRLAADGEVPVRIEVVDSGVGIPKRQLQRVFDAFRQVDGSTSRKYGGTGLGLAICKSLTERMGHQIEVESEVGKGSTFIIQLGTRPHRGRKPRKPRQAAREGAHGE
jgi:PAS domain S-box-containing protein